MKITSRVHTMAIAATALLVLNGCAGPNKVADTASPRIPDAGAENRPAAPRSLPAKLWKP